MNGIIRKRLLALFSAVGLVGSTASASGQVLKGSEPDPNQKTESKIKADKNKQENNAAKGQATIKGNKTNAPADAASKDASKFNKAGSETAVSKDSVTQKGRKYNTDALVVKQKTSEAKRKKHAAETNITPDGQVKLKGQAKHVQTMQTEAHIKGEKHAAETNAGQNEANKKASQTTPK